MRNPENRFKRALKEGRQQIGVWNSIPSPAVTELLGLAGFDWVLLDTEHSPVEVADLMPGLMALESVPEASAVVRPAWNDPVLIKRVLDLGAQTVLVPYIETVEQAEAAVRAVRYPPRGLRGVAGMTRASRYGSVTDYLKLAEEEICLLLQIETRAGLDRLEEIASVDGVDGIFFGPSDLSSSLGHPGDQGHAEVVGAIEDGIARLKSIGVPSGILTLNQEFARRCIELGTGFTAVGLDMGMLSAGSKALVAGFKG